MVTARAASIHHKAHAIVAAQRPHAGTQTNTIKLTMVPRPMGKQPKNRDDLLLQIVDFADKTQNLRRGKATDNSSPTMVILPGKINLGLI
ncbi:hypothetical protein KCU59_g15464, partial [Aureobasidium melanogenum]